MSRASRDLFRRNNRLTKWRQAMTRASTRHDLMQKQLSAADTRPQWAIWNKWIFSFFSILSWQQCQLNSKWFQSRKSKSKAKKWSFGSFLWCLARLHPNSPMPMLIRYRFFATLARENVKCNCLIFIYHLFYTSGVKTIYDKCMDYAGESTDFQQMCLQTLFNNDYYWSW